jgi:hypothetical protein
MHSNAPGGGPPVTGFGVQECSGLEELIPNCHAASIRQSLHVSK